MRLPVADGRTLALVVRHGTVEINGREIARSGQLIVRDRDGSDVQIKANGEATALLLSGEPLDEPVRGHGPFVVNTEAQIAEAIDDFSSGCFGKIAPLVV